MKKRLTDLVVEKTKAPETGRLEIFDTHTLGLALRITANNARSFVVRARIKGQAQPITITLGDASRFDLATVRELAREKLRSMAAGIDPRAEPMPEGYTVDVMIGEWATLQLGRARQRYREETPRALRRGIASLLDREASTITKADAVRAVDALLVAGKTGAARNLLAYARAAFGWAQKRGAIPVNSFAELPVSTHAVQRERTLSAEEITAIWNAAGTIAYPFGPFFKLAMLTLQRREEVAGMRWSEIKDDLWTIPGSRMKKGRAHDVHLSPAALDVLATIPPRLRCDFVFSTTGTTSISGFSRGKRTIDRAIAKSGATIDPWTMHDFRRSGVSTLAEMGFDSVVVDKLLAHEPSKLSAVARIYQRHGFGKERAEALDAWARFVLGAATEAERAAQ